MLKERPSSPLAGASEEEIEAALGQIKSGEMMTTPVEDKESAARRQKAAELEHQQRIKESVKRVKEFEARKAQSAIEDASKAEELRRAIGVAGLKEKTGKKRVAFDKDAQRAFELFGMIAETTRKGLGDKAEGAGAKPVDIRPPTREEVEALRKRPPTPPAMAA